MSDSTQSTDNLEQKAYDAWLKSLTQRAFSFTRRTREQTRMTPWWMAILFFVAGIMVGVAVMRFMGYLG
jgi:hypothetical protein